MDDPTRSRLCELIEALDITSVRPKFIQRLDEGSRVSGSLSATRLSPATLGSLPFHITYLPADQTRIDDLHGALPDVLAPPVDGLAMTELHELRTIVRSASVLANETTMPLEGETGLYPLIMSYVLEPVNAVIRRTVTWNTTFQLYWRVTSGGNNRGGSGETDMKLIFRYMVPHRAGVERVQEIVLAIFEVKTSRSMPSSSSATIDRATRYGGRAPLVYEDQRFRGGGTTLQSNEHNVVEQVSLVSLSLCWPSSLRWDHFSLSLIERPPACVLLVDDA